MDGRLDLGWCVVECATDTCIILLASDTPTISVKRKKVNMNSEMQ